MFKKALLAQTPVALAVEEEKGEREGQRAGNETFQSQVKSYSSVEPIPQQTSVPVESVVGVEPYSPVPTTEDEVVTN